MALIQGRRSDSSKAKESKGSASLDTGRDKGSRSHDEGDERRRSSKANDAGVRRRDDERRRDAGRRDGEPKTRRNHDDEPSASRSADDPANDHSRHADYMHERARRRHLPYDDERRRKRRRSRSFTDGDEDRYRGDNERRHEDDKRRHRQSSPQHDAKMRNGVDESADVPLRRHRHRHSTARDDEHDSRSPSHRRRHHHRRRVSDKAHGKSSRRADSRRSDEDIDSHHVDRRSKTQLRDRSGSAGQGAASESPPHNVSQQDDLLCSIDEKEPLSTQ